MFTAENHLSGGSYPHAFLHGFLLFFKHLLFFFFFLVRKHNFAFGKLQEHKTFQARATTMPTYKRETHLYI